MEAEEGRLIGGEPLACTLSTDRGCQLSADSGESTVESPWTVLSECMKFVESNLNEGKSVPYTVWNDELILQAEMQIFGHGQVGQANKPGVSNVHLSSRCDVLRFIKCNFQAMFLSALPSLQLSDIKGNPIVFTCALSLE